MKYILENNNSNYKKEVEEIINNNLSYIINFFNKESINIDSKIYIYNSIESLKDNLYKRGFDKDPDYMCACFKDQDNSLNFFEPKDNPSNTEWSKEEYKQVIVHELIHSVIYTLFGYIPEWFNEGIAKYLDNSYPKDYYTKLSKVLDINNLPKQEEIINEFGLHDYDSYDYAYLMVSYIIIVKGKDYLVDLLNNKEKINNVSNTLLVDAVKYFKRLEDEKN